MKPIILNATKYFFPKKDTEIHIVVDFNNHDHGFIICGDDLCLDDEKLFYNDCKKLNYDPKDFLATLRTESLKCEKYLELICTHDW